MDAPTSEDAAIDGIDATQDAGLDGALDGGADAFDAGTVPPGRPFGSTVQAGLLSTCAIHRNRTYCWGHNGRGQLGRPGGNASSPVLADHIGPHEFISLRGQHACAQQGTELTCWGENEHGQLGDGMTIDRTEAMPPMIDGALQIAASYTHTCFLAEDRTLWCAGRDAEGEFARMPGGVFSTPIQVSTELFSQASILSGHLCAIRFGGALWCAGRNSAHELGQGSLAEEQIAEFVPVGGDKRWRQVVSGQSHTCAITMDDVLYCWGSNASGQLGNGEMIDGDRDMAQPVPLQVMADVASVATDTFHVCVIRLDGRLSCWGRNDEGQLGTGDIMDRLIPTEIGTETDWVEISVGRFHTCGRRADDSVWCWGENEDGRLGTGDLNRRNRPTEVAFPGEGGE